MKVRVVEKQGVSVLVEWMVGENYYRKVVDRKHLIGDEITDSKLDLYPSYGIRWERYLDLSDITPEKLGRELHRRGVWTVEDLTLRRKEVNRAITQVFGTKIQEAIAAASKSGKWR